jgi:hypothetical protein
MKNCAKGEKKRGEEKTFLITFEEAKEDFL